MANEKHLLLSAIGGWTDSALSAETWQVGIRLALVFGSVDLVGTLPNNWDPSAASISRTETDWTIDGNWNVPHGGLIFAPDDYLNDVAAPAFGAWLSGISGLSNKAQLRQLKLSPIGTDGKLVPAPPYASGTPCTLNWTASFPVGGNGGEILPLQIAVVASHRTPQVGRPGRGRMFVPGFTGSATDSHGHLSSAVQSSVLSNQVTLLEALSISDVVPGSVNVRPIVTGGGYSKYGTITQVKVGNVMDTQRRRRRSLVESFSSSAVSY